MCIAAISSSRVVPSFFDCISSVCSLRILQTALASKSKDFSVQLAITAEPLGMQRHFSLLRQTISKAQDKNKSKATENTDEQCRRYRTIAVSAASLAATAMVMRLTASVASFSATMHAALAVSARSMRAAAPADAREHTGTYTSGKCMS